MPDSRTYTAPWLEVEHLSGVIRDWLANQDFETQVLPTPGGQTVQARKTQFLQQGIALTVQVAKHNDLVQVQVGTGKWALHAAEGVAALILFWPLLAIPAWAAYRLKETMDDTWQFVERYVAMQGEVEVPVFGASATPRPVAKAEPSRFEPEAPTTVCAQCGQPISPEAKFCANCGAKQQVVCPQCGQNLRADAKFCENCGARIEASQS